MMMKGRESSDPIDFDKPGRMRRQACPRYRQWVKAPRHPFVFPENVDSQHERLCQFIVA